MTEFDLGALLTALDGAGVEHVVIGGVAVGAHGYIRATEDLDIVPKPAAQNHERLAEALVDLDASVPTAGDRSFDPGADLRALRQGKNISLETRFGGLDVIQRIPGLPAYDELEAHGDKAVLLGTPVLVCSLAHLRAMKERGGRSQDRADLDNLPS
jgi:hypothetical protein